MHAEQLAQLVAHRCLADISFYCIMTIIFPQANSEDVYEGVGGRLKRVSPTASRLQCACPQCCIAEWKKEN